MLGRAISNKLPECIFEHFENHRGDLSQELPKPNMWLLVNHAKKKHFALKLIYFNSGKLQISKRLFTKQRTITKNKSVNGAILIAISRVNIKVILLLLFPKRIVLYHFLLNNNCNNSLMTNSKVNSIQNGRAVFNHFLL